MFSDSLQYDGKVIGAKRAEASLPWRIDLDILICLGRIRLFKRGQ
jgi:hypothetical protein